MRYELSDYEWTAVKPMLPNKPRGVRRLNDRRVLNGLGPTFRCARACRGQPRLAFFEATKAVDGRDKPGHDDDIESHSLTAPEYTFRPSR